MLSYRIHSLLSLNMLVLCGTNHSNLDIAFNLQVKYTYDAWTPGTKKIYGLMYHLTYCEKYCNAITWSTVLTELQV